MNQQHAISNLIKAYSYCFQSKIKHCKHCEKKINAILNPMLKHKKPISFVLPAFPAKSSSREKTISPLPDLGEKLALQRLDNLCHAISSIYQPGAKLVICADGHVFNDIVMVSNDDVYIYQKALRNLTKKYNFKHISFFELENAYQSTNYQNIRQKLIDEHGTPIDKIRENCIKDKNEKHLFCGLHRFLYEDLRYHYPSHSKNKIKNIAKIKTYQTLQRSHAWSHLIKKLFPNDLRLSIHPHFCGSEKISIQLFSDQDAWKTPWHNVVLNDNGKQRLIKQKEAIAMGATLSVSESPWEKYYDLNQKVS